MHHDLKLHPKHFFTKALTLKSWEIRRFDRPFKTDDTVTFHEWSPDRNCYEGGRIGPFRIQGPIVTEAPGLQGGYCIFQHSPYPE